MRIFILPALIGAYLIVDSKCFNNCFIILMRTKMFCVAVNGKYKGLGSFDTAIAAALAYDQAAIKAGKKKSSLNFPDGLPIKQESDIDDSEGFWV